MLPMKINDCRRKFPPSQRTGACWETALLFFTTCTPSRFIFFGLKWSTISETVDVCKCVFAASKHNIDSSLLVPFKRDESQKTISKEETPSKNLNVAGKNQVPQSHICANWGDSRWRRSVALTTTPPDLLHRNTVYLKHASRLNIHVALGPSPNLWGH